MKLEGEIGELDLVERLVELGREHFTGAVRFENDGIIKIIYFKGGDILSASTNDRTDSVDEILLRAGKVSREHVKQALAKRKENETLGDALLGLGFITRKELTWARRVQVIGVIRSIAAWPAGSFQIVPDYLPKREEGTQFPLPQIIVEVVVTDQDRAKFDRALDGGNAVFAKTDEFEFEWARLGLNQDADAISAWIDGSHSAAEIASLSGKDAFNVYKLLHALSLLGLLRATGERPAEMEVEAVADASDAWAAPPPVPPPPPSPVRSAFDDDEPPAMEMAIDPMPEPEPEPAYLPPIPPSPPPKEAPPPITMDPEWGFDDAQIETARRATVEPEPAKEVVVEAAKGNRWIGLLFGAVALIGVVFGGFAAWNWYQEKNAPPPAPVVVPRPRVRKPAPVTGTVVPMATTTTQPPVTTTTVAPMVIKPPATTTSGGQAPSPVRTGGAPVLHPPVPTNTTTPLPTVKPLATDASRSHFDEMAKTFAAQATGNFTVQFELVCETPSLTKAIKDGGSAVWFVPISYRNRSCYRVFWGHYATRDEASRAAREIPMSLRGVSPAVVKIPRP